MSRLGHRKLFDDFWLAISDGRSFISSSYCWVCLMISPKLRELTDCMGRHNPDRNGAASPERRLISETPHAE
jgi:hypothetical protein